MVNYVAGFLFSKTKQEVLLIEKTKPAWQKGRLNGIGGKIESTDSKPEYAMSREFQEEAGVWISPENWNLFCIYTWEGGIVNFYYSIDEWSTLYHQVWSASEEEVNWYEVQKIYSGLPTIYNLKWLLPLALDPSLQEFFKGNHIHIHE